MKTENPSAKKQPIASIDYVLDERIYRETRYKLLMTATSAKGDVTSKKPQLVARYLVQLHYFCNYDLCRFGTLLVFVINQLTEITSLQLQGATMVEKVVCSEILEIDRKFNSYLTVLLSRHRSFYFPDIKCEFTVFGEDVLDHVRSLSMLPRLLAWKSW